jgi:alpha-beta hydrolase superfamily lysophospholipase
MLKPEPRIDFFTSSDGYRSAVRVWDVREPIGRIIYVHGVMSHGGWYLNSCRHLAAEGFEVHFVERRGSGLNLQNRGDVPHYEVWLEDLERYLTSLPDTLPTVLLGVSWGGKLAVAFARYRPQLIAGFGMLCPGLFEQQSPHPVKKAGLRLAGIAGRHKMNVTIPLRDAALFTDSPRHQAYVGLDPLTLRKTTVRFALADRALTRYALEAPHEIRVPVLVMLGIRDRIVDNERVRAFVQRLGTDDRTVIEYSAAHTLEFEPDPAFFKDLSSWARAITSPKSIGSVPAASSRPATKCSAAHP